MINVVKSDSCGASDNGKTLITVSSEVQDVTPGKSGVVYPLTLTNTGSASKTYSIEAITGTWADVKVSPSIVVMNPGEIKIVYVTVAANEDASEGMQTFGVAVKSD